MLARGTTVVARVVPLYHAAPVRGMATAQALRQRITSVKNISKITAAMKMVAVCKLRVAQENLARARGFARAVDAVKFKPTAEVPVTSKCYLAISSDRGLCGAINSSIVRGIRDRILVDREAGLKDLQILIIGEKAKQGLERLFSPLFKVTISETSKFKPCTFKQCGEITDNWSAMNVQQTSVLYQKFVSMIAYETTESKYWSYDACKDSVATEFADYEMEGDADILQNLHEFKSCVKLFHYFAENDTSTLSARMQAMDNSSTNAKDMIASLGLILNRNRQAKITTELSEIISGAAASEETM